ncbi:MAG: ADP-ribosylglycohydrolase family protein [Bacteroidales bacterium]|nr:ADP-ribosylglycohydrolase family protein [Bacteroidales bacterium]
MLGAIIGDIVGSIYEFDNIKKKDFPFITDKSSYTDDSIMTIAVAEWLLTDNEHTHEALENVMVRYADKYKFPMGGYGGGFAQWLFRPERLIDYKTGEIAGKRVPYNSWGNGSAMRISAVGWKFRTLEDTEKVAAISASITHDHPEGIKGAQATAAAIFLARTGRTKQEIKDYIETRFGYDLSVHTDELRKTYGWEDSCQGTVPPAIRAFLDSTDFEDAVRIAVSLGGDSDTLACITGGIAEAYYQHIPDTIQRQAVEKLPAEFLIVMDYFKQGSFYQQMSPREVMGRADSAVERRYTPEHIKELKEGEVFVFGSNLDGAHGGGAAAAAVRYFGAVWGQGVGMQGQSYAIPTMHGGVDVIKPYVDEFIQYAKEHPELTFLVTRIGCGIAGFRDAEIAPLFAPSLNLENVILPKSFVENII